MSTLDTIKSRLTDLAFKQTISFCYVCYKEAPLGWCEDCGSDDLMRLLPGNGVEYGTDWVVEDLLFRNLRSIDIDQAFEQSLEDLYPATVQVGWMELDTIRVMKEMDSVWWKMGRDEWLDAEIEDERLITFDEKRYYWTSDVETFLDAAELGVARRAG